MDKYEAIRNVSLFEGISDDQYVRLNEIAVMQTFARGDLLFEAGVEATGFYAPVEGRVKIYRLSPSGKEQILHIFGPGEAFGEVPVFQGSTFPAHGQALDDLTVLFFRRSAFREMLRNDPDMAMAMLALLSQRLRILVNKIDDLSLKEAPSRVASHLLLLRASQDSDTIRLDLPKGQIAYYLGTIQETLSRIFKKFSEQGIIEINGKDIIILDPEELESIAEEGR